MLPTSRILFLAPLIVLAGCSAATVSRDAAVVAKNTAAVKQACDEAAPLAAMAAAIPAVGIFVAAGVQAVCASDAAIAKAAADPTTVAWLGQQSQMLRDALAKFKK